MGKKLILLTNDNGIDSGGISILYNILKEDKRFSVRVVTPDKESAVSIDNLIDPDCRYTADFTCRIAGRIMENGGLPRGTLLNINVPDVPEKEIKGVKITMQSGAKFKDNFIKRVDPRGRDYYWMDGEFIGNIEDLNFDYDEIKSNYVSVTPIHYDMTDYEKLDYFKK